MTYIDDDAYELAARRHATMLRANPPPNGPRAAHSGVDVRPRPGRQFVLSEIGPGWVVYDGRTEEGRFERPNLVVETIHTTYTDVSDGEIVQITRFRCLVLPFNPAAPWTTLDAADIDTDSLAGVDRVMASGAARWLVKPLNLRHGRHQLNLEETEALHVAARLAAALAQ